MITLEMLYWWAQHVGTDSAIYKALKKEYYDRGCYGKSYGESGKERE